MTEAEFSAFLKDISDCFIAEDFGSWADRVELPFSIVTKYGPHISHSTQDLKDEFDLYVLACRTMKLDLVFRTPVSIENCEDGTVIATYRTELLSHGQRMTEPFTSSALMQKTDGHWRMTAILNARGHDSWTGNAAHKEGPQE